MQLTIQPIQEIDETRASGKQIKTKITRKYTSIEIEAAHARGVVSRVDGAVESGEINDCEAVNVHEINVSTELEDHAGWHSGAACFKCLLHSLPISAAKANDALHHSVACCRS